MTGGVIWKGGGVASRPDEAVCTVGMSSERGRVPRPELLSATKSSGGRAKLSGVIDPMP